MPVIFSYIAWQITGHCKFAVHIPCLCCLLFCQFCFFNSFVLLFCLHMCQTLHGNIITQWCQICKDKDEAEVWFAGLKTLISRSHQRKWRTDSGSDTISSAATSPRTCTRRSSPLSSPFSRNDSVHKVLFTILIWIGQSEWYIYF